MALCDEYRRHVAQQEELIGHLRMVGEDWRIQSNERQFYIDHLTKEIYKSTFISWKMVKKVVYLLQTSFPIGRDGQKIINFLEEARDQYDQVKNFFGCNARMNDNM